MTHLLKTNAVTQPTECNRVALVRGEHRWIFRWEPGAEAALIGRIAQLASDPSAPLDWFDAAAVCKQVLFPPKKTSSRAKPQTENSA